MPLKVTVWRWWWLSVLVGAVRLSAVCAESKLDVTLAVIGVSTTGVADALA
jgi:hypothetical protein